MKRLVDFYRNLFVQNIAWLKTTVKWFMASAVLGAVFFFIKPELLKTIVNAFTEKFGADPALDFHLVIQIFLQNVQASAIALFGGLLFGLGSILIVGINGFLLGFIIMSLFSGSHGNFAVSLGLALGGLVPHGIFELPAFLISATLGLRLGLEWIGKNALGNRWKILKLNFIHSLIIIPVIALILFLAALIEVYVSGRIVNNF